MHRQDAVIEVVGAAGARHVTEDEIAGNEDGALRYQITMRA